MRTRHPTVLEGAEEDNMQEAPVASVPGQLVATLSLDLVTPAEAIDCTKDVISLLLAMQLEEVAETQFELQDAPRTMAY
jgi:hypothetical protein